MSRAILFAVFLGVVACGGSAFDPNTVQPHTGFGLALVDNSKWALSGPVSGTLKLTWDNNVQVGCDRLIVIAHRRAAVALAQPRLQSLAAHQPSDVLAADGDALRV